MWGRSTRLASKLTGKTKWYRKESKSEIGEMENGGNGVSNDKTCPGSNMKRSSNFERKRSTNPLVTNPRVASPLFVPPTRDNKLVRAMKEEEVRMTEITGWGWRLIERGGVTLSNLLTRSNLFGKEDCQREDCKACGSALKPLDCRRRGV